MAYSILVLTLACFFGRISSMENEPKCYSRFDYEVKLLEKTLQNDIQMKQALEKLDKTLKEVEAEKAEFHDANERLKTLIDEFKENTSTELLQKPQSSLGAETPVILFNARTLKHKTPSRGSRLMYTTVSQNIGGAFDPDTGIFTAPVNGTYLFSVQISTQQNQWGRVKTVVNNNEVHSIAKYNTAAGCSTTSGTTVQFLEKKSQVWVKEDEYSSNSEYCDGSYYGWNQFSGVLLHH